jgi:hypothetical protein
MICDLESIWFKKISFRSLLSVLQNLARNDGGRFVSFLESFVVEKEEKTLIGMLN